MATHAPCYSARFVQPIAEVLSVDENVPVRAVHALQAVDPTTRIPLAMAHRIAARLVRQTGDLDLGLKAGRAMSLGRGGALDYAMYSAATMRDAIALAHRYGRLFSDSLRVHHKVEGRRATVFIDLGPATPRVVSDFAMSAWFMSHIRLALAGSSSLECCFAHPKPVNTTEYERTFGPAALRFNAPCCAFSFDREYLDTPLPTAEPIIHAVFCEHAALNFGQLRDSRTFMLRARESAMSEWLQGGPTVSGVACQLAMTPRDLKRTLEREGTTYRALIDDVRRELALRYVGSPEIPFVEIALLLGFSRIQAFNRAFRRWTGQTPLKHRRSRRDLNWVDGAVKVAAIRGAGSVFSNEQSQAFGDRMRG